MAGAVPKQRGGSNATTIGMVSAVVVAVLLLGALIWLITQQEQLRTNATQATAARDRANRDLEDMRKATSLLAGGVTGNPNETPQDARARLEEMLAGIRSTGRVSDTDQMTTTVGAVGVIDRLHQQYLAQLDAKEKLTESFGKANADLRAALAANDELQKKFGDDLAGLRVKVDELQTAKSDFERLKAEETQALASQIGAKQDALNALRRDQVTVRQRLKEELDRRDSLLNEQRQALSMLRGPGPEGAQELSLARAGVGSVMRALPGDSLVHVDLGAENGVRLGMTFAVYSSDERIPADGRGKAHLEVVSVGRRTSECRVTTRPSPDNPILEGDRIGNIVLSRDRARKQRFCIVGQFDIDFDGQPDVRGQDAIAALVRRFGGEVVAQVDAMTDYVIVGLEPPAEAPEPEDLFADDEAPGAATRTQDETEAESYDEDDEDAADDIEESETGAEDEEEPAADTEEADEEEADASDEGEDEESADESDESDDETDDESDAGSDEEESDELARWDDRFDASRVSRLNSDPATAAPTIRRSGEVDPTKGPRERRVLTERQRYDEAVRKAMLLSIPRLPQDRFFNFVGLESGREAMRALEQ